MKNVKGGLLWQRVFSTAKVGDRGQTFTRPEVLSDLASKILKDVTKEESYGTTA